MIERKPKVIKREAIDARKDEERSIEITMLQVLVRRYTDKARKFVREAERTAA